MPTFSADQLHEIAFRVLQGADVGPEHAHTVATELADANLMGHDSHGLIRLMQYVDQIQKGYIRPDAPVNLVLDKPSLAVVDGGYNLGQVVARKALDLGTARARENGSFTVLCRNCWHVGRLGSYTWKAALQDFVAIMSVNGPGGGSVVPWGGLDQRVGTNPISIAAPRDDQPILLDMTTSVTAEGKIRVAYEKGESLPPGWIMDADGNPSVDPADMYRDPPGAILPLGAAMGFKGYGLAVMLDIICGVLSGFGVVRPDVPIGANGVWLYLIDVKQLMPPDEYKGWIEKYVSWIKSSRKAPGVSEILMPGDIELQRQETRQAEGVVLPDETWRRIRELADGLGVSLQEI